MQVSLLTVINRSKIPDSYLIGSSIVSHQFIRVVTKIYKNRYGDKRVKYDRITIRGVGSVNPGYETSFSDFFERPISGISGAVVTTTGKSRLIFTKA